MGFRLYKVRRYRSADAWQVGILIAETYAKFNLPEITPEKRKSMLGPFAFAHSTELEHQRDIADAISAPSVWVAEENGQVVGVLRGGRVDGKGRTVLSSLFVAEQAHRRGVGRALVEAFEQEYIAKGVKVFKLSATLHAIQFYLSVGYKKSTGLRSMRSFEEHGLPYQPMKKIL